MKGPIGRRVVLRILGAVPLVAVLPTVGCSDDDTEVVPPKRFFTVAERAVVATLADVVIPDEPSSPGGAKLGAVAYIEQLLTAFESDPPALFADGPYSGRQPFADGTVPPNDFARFMPLDRVVTQAWKLRIEKLRELFTAGIGPLAQSGVSKEEAAEVFRGLDDELQGALVDLVSQAAFGAPEYGGNPDRAGWALARFEGDTQPLGYSIFDEAAGAYRERPDAPMSTADPRPDPAPLDEATLALLGEVIAFTGGKVFP
jgi:hypothetical protein